MHRPRLVVLAVLVGTLGLFLTSATRVHSQRRPATLTERLAAATKLSEENAERFLNAVGGAIAEDLRAGRQVTLPGLGTFRVVRIAEHKDMAAGGRPFIVPATNRVEFVSSLELGDAANAPGARPAETVPQFEYIPIPGQTPGQKAGQLKSHGLRTR